MGFFGGGGGAAGVGGSTGSTDRAILRASGTGGATLQNSDLNVDDASTTTQNNVTITNQHSGQTNSALVLTPKGTGAFIVGPKPDGTATGGGNARGANAICINTRRTAATQVGSGADCVNIGSLTTCSDNNSVVIGNGASSTGGGGNVVIGTEANSNQGFCVALGRRAAATGDRCVAIGDQSRATGANSIAIGFRFNSLASGDGAVAIGSVTSSLRQQFGTDPFFSIFWSGTTTNNTASVLNLGGVATNRFTIAANTAVIANLYIIARRTDVLGKYFSGQRKVAIRRDNSNSTAIIGSVETIGADQTEGSPTWSVAITADDTNEALQCEVTGATSETVSWRVMAFYHVV